MAKSAAAARTGRPARSARIPWYERLDRFFYPILGPSQVGDPNEPPPPPLRTDLRCPLCHNLMSDHEVERSATIGRLYCPPAADGGTARNPGLAA
jgi:hypothetical protein